MTDMKCRQYCFLLLTVILMVACDPSNHPIFPEDLFPQYEYDGETAPGTPLGYISPELIWEDEEDEGTEITSVNVTIIGSDGHAKTLSFNSPEEVAEYIQQLPEGEYDLLVTVNMTPEGGYILENDVVSLLDASASPDQAFFSINHVVLKGGTVTIVECPLQRLLSRLTINLTGEPEGTVVSVQVEHVAQNVALTQKNQDGSYGVPSETGTTVVLPGQGTLMPTAAGYSRTTICITVTVPDGRVIPITVDAPGMEMGKEYQIDLMFSDISADIELSTITINDWAEGWTVNEDQTL